VRCEEAEEHDSIQSPIVVQTMAQGVVHGDGIEQILSAALSIQKA
jgi:hypothetical protein